MAISPQIHWAFIEGAKQTASRPHGVWPLGKNGVMQSIGRGKVSMEKEESECQAGRGKGLLTPEFVLKRTWM